MKKELSPIVTWAVIGVVVAAIVGFLVLRSSNAGSLRPGGYTAMPGTGGTPAYTPPSAIQTQQTGGPPTTNYGAPPGMPGAPGAPAGSSAPPGMPGGYSPPSGMPGGPQTR